MSKHVLYYSLSEFKNDSMKLASKIKKKYWGIYPVPQGGIALGMELSKLLDIPILGVRDLKDVKGRDILIIDDLIDSGKTRSKFPDNDFACIHIKSHAEFKMTGDTYAIHERVVDWIVYWWEGNEDKSIEDAVIRQLEYIGENPNREGLIETPKRVVKSWGELFSGYGQKPEDIMKTFMEGACDELVLLKDVEMYSVCEHHLLPFFGKCHVAYIPDKKVIGISKLARLVNMYSRRTQIQERIGEQVTTALMKYLKPKAAACIIEAQHLCMLMRGVQKQNSVMITSSLKGVFLTDNKAREELMRLIK